ncbi:MAG: hypothetical protein IPH38_18505 [Candidatus Microthrix sp.]|nr:hypothetical protein [Candidatus Microthrix sp.]
MFLDADTGTLVRRYRSTRRRHPQRTRKACRETVEKGRSAAIYRDQSDRLRPGDQDHVDERARPATPAGRLITHLASGG